MVKCPLQLEVNNSERHVPPARHSSINNKTATVSWREESSLESMGLRGITVDEDGGELKSSCLVCTS